MTVVISIGRRIPRNWFRRQGTKAAGLMSFQTNMWTMIRQSMQLAKRKANASGKLNFVMTFDNEIEDLHYQLEWMKIIIQGNEEQEKEEYEEALQMYAPLNKLFKKDMPKDKNISKQFKSKMLSATKMDEAYKAGYGSVQDKNMANQLLELGIITHIEWIKDFDSRKADF